MDEPLTIYQASTGGLSADAGHMLSEALRLMDERLLSGLRGAERVLWRQRTISYQNYKAALTARSCSQHAGELQYDRPRESSFQTLIPFAVK